MDFFPKWWSGRQWRVEYTFEELDLAAAVPDVPSRPVAQQWVYEVTAESPETVTLEAADPRYPTSREILVISRQDLSLVGLEQVDALLPN